VRVEAQSAGDTLTEALALTALGDAILRQTGDSVRAQALIDRALALQANETDADAHFDSLMVRASIAISRGRMADALPYIEEGFTVALAAGRKDLQTIAAQALAQAHIVRLELDKAERLIGKALELADESGSPRARGVAKLAWGWLCLIRKELDAAEAAYEEGRALFAEIGHATLLSVSLYRIAEVALEKHDPKRAEKLIREAIRLIAPLGQHLELAQSQAQLAVALAEQGKVDEAERFVLEAQEHLPITEPFLQLAITIALASIRTAEDREDEAEALYREALALADELDFAALQAEALRKLVGFLADRGRGDDAAPYEERLAVLVPAESTARIA